MIFVVFVVLILCSLVVKNFRSTEKTNPLKAQIEN